MQGAFQNGVGEMVMPSIYMIFKGVSITHKQYLNIIFSYFRKLKYENTMNIFSKMQCPTNSFPECGLYIYLYMVHISLNDSGRDVISMLIG